jgi:hypothetical protein
LPWSWDNRRLAVAGGGRGAEVSVVSAKCAMLKIQSFRVFLAKVANNPNSRQDVHLHFPSSQHQQSNPGSLLQDGQRHDPTGMAMSILSSDRGHYCAYRLPGGLQTVSGCSCCCCRTTALKLCSGRDSVGPAGSGETITLCCWRKKERQEVQGQPFVGPQIPSHLPHRH